MQCAFTKTLKWWIPSNREASIQEISFLNLR
jgi:hypothetical protein